MQNPTENKPMQTAAVLVIGNEILSGRTQDMNIRYIGEKMAQHGIPLAEVRIVPDIEGKIMAALNDLRVAHDFVFTTGGIGPTHDDITAESVAKAFGLPYGTHSEAYCILEQHYGAENFTPPRQKMAMMPPSASLIPNPVSGAPGFIVENVYVMAGVPRIMQAMFDHVLGLIAPGDPILSNTIGTALAESLMAEGLGQIQKHYPQVDIGSYPHFRDGTPATNVVLRGRDVEPLKAATRAVLDLVSQYEGEPRTISFQAPIEV
jgi:molybdenum cofactor synthesis domain-containing protein